MKRDTKKNRSIRILQRMHRLEGEPHSKLILSVIHTTRAFKVPGVHSGGLTLGWGEGGKAAEDLELGHKG